jgi:predicted DsbA family dithiol-disulfide isomerase
VRIEKLRQEFDLDIRWSVFPLHPNTPEAGMSLDDLFAGQMDIVAMMSRLKRVADELELPFGDRSQTFSSRRAQELGKWAEEMRAGDAFHQAVYRAYFVDGKNIAEKTVLMAIADSLGLDPGKAFQVLEDGRFAAAVNADWHRADELAVTAVPTMVYKGRKLVGFRSYVDCRELIADESV